MVEGTLSSTQRRTRAALVSAARELIARGVTPTVEDAARAAEVSRTTAYRYFPTKTALLVAAHPETGEESLLGLDPPADVRVRLDRVVDRFVDVVLRSEEQQRTMLRISLEASPEVRATLPLRQGRAIGWISEALEPLCPELSDDGVRRLALAIRSAVGIEALVWLRDVAGLSAADAAETMRWSARAMLEAALSAGPPGGHPADKVAP
jgi:AcrR family transcriptional regulator